MPTLLYLTNLLGRINDRMINKIWENRFSHETVVNFVYKVSEREFEKFAAGLNLPMIAIKKLNPNFWYLGSEHIKADRKEKAFRRIPFRKKIRDFFLIGVSCPARHFPLPSLRICPMNPWINPLPRKDIDWSRSRPCSGLILKELKYNDIASQYDEKTQVWILTK